MNFYPFPKIPSFSTLIYEIKKECEKKEKTLPVLDFKGTVKLHGTNGGIIWNKESNTIQVQSKNINLTQNKTDNCGFKAFILEHESELKKMFNRNFSEYSDIVMYGEFCGGNVQKGVALSQLDKQFVIFSIKNLKTGYLKISDTVDYYFKTIYSIPVYSITIDFNKPEESLNKLHYFTNKVESECPWAKQFGVSGTGEGIVWTSKKDSDYYSFKTKGSKHQVTQNRSTIPIDPILLEQRQFIKNSFTENRIQQGISYIKEINSDNFKKDFNLFMIKDILTEEIQTIEFNGYKENVLKKIISQECKLHYHLFE